MKYVLVITILMVSFTANASKDRYSNEQWKTWGSSGALVLPLEDSKPNDSSFYGLILECNRKGLFRIAVKDIHSGPGDLIEWETDKRMGTIQNQASMVIRTESSAIDQNNLIVEALKISEWIEFRNTTKKSSAKYSLNGFAKAINSTKCKVP